MIFTRLTSISLAVTLLLTAVPFAEAASVSDVLKTHDTQLVSRGDFIRAVSKLFGDGGGASVALPYNRVPRGLKPYVGELFEAGALGHLGRELLYAKPITRGQALEIIVTFQEIAVEDTASSKFTDVRPQTDSARAVSYALDNDWMTPLRDNYFGVRRSLTGKDAKYLLKMVNGEDTTKRSTIPSRLKRRQAEEAEKVKVNVNLQAPGSSLELPRQSVMSAIWHILKQHFIYEDRLDGLQVSHDMIDTMLKSLKDPYSVYMKPREATNFTNTITNNHGAGIGAQVRQVDGEVEIVSPLPGSPAEKAGLLPRDRILKVDGKDITGMSFGDAVSLIKGKEGSEVVLQVRRNGSVIVVTVKRAPITIPEIEISWQDDISIIKIRQFGKTTENKLYDELVKLNNQNPAGLILDLRGNPGGLLSAATELLGNFLPKGTVVAHIITRQEEQKETTKHDPSIDMSVPMVVLVNGGSASASEISAGALRDHRRATVLGVKTFGKGTVQSFLTTSDGAAFKFTTGKWLTPNRQEIEGKGVTPDIIVENGDDDQQMKRALDLLRRR